MVACKRGLGSGPLIFWFQLLIASLISYCNWLYRIFNILLIASAFHQTTHFRINLSRIVENDFSILGTRD